MKRRGMQQTQLKCEHGRGLNEERRRITKEGLQEKNSERKEGRKEVGREAEGRKKGRKGDLKDGRAQ